MWTIYNLLNSMTVGMTLPFIVQSLDLLIHKLYTTWKLSETVKLNDVKKMCDVCNMKLRYRVYSSYLLKLGNTGFPIAVWHENISQIF